MHLQPVIQPPPPTTRRCKPPPPGVAPTTHPRSSSHVHSSHVHKRASVTACWHRVMSTSASVTACWHRSTRGCPLPSRWSFLLSRGIAATGRAEGIQPDRLCHTHTQTHTQIHETPAAYPRSVPWLSLPPTTSCHPDAPSTLDPMPARAQSRVPRARGRTGGAGGEGRGEQIRRSDNVPWPWPWPLRAPSPWPQPWPRSLPGCPCSRRASTAEAGVHGV